MDVGILDILGSPPAELQIGVSGETHTRLESFVARALGGPAGSGTSCVVNGFGGGMRSQDPQHKRHEIRINAGTPGSLWWVGTQHGCHDSGPVF